MDTKLHELLKSFEIAEITRSIDRIRIVIENGMETHEYLKTQFRLHFSYVKTTKVRNVITTHYEHSTSRIYLSNDFTRWLRIDLCDPTGEVQRIISKILGPNSDLSVDSNVYISLNQVEFTLDIYPKNQADIEPILNYIDYHLVMTRSREDSYRRYLNTRYQGLRGDIRNGSYGIRLYINREEDTDRVRIELQMNHDGLRNRGFDVGSLPLSTNLVEPTEFFNFREGLNNNSISTLAKSIVNKRWDGKSKPSKMRRTWEINRYRKDVTRVILGAKELLKDVTVPGRPPVALQINRFKHFRKQHRINVQVDQIFPKL